jgi:hypothetical protein
VVNDTTYEELSTKWDALNFINSNSQAKEIDFELMKIRRFWTWFRPLMKWWFWIRAWFSLWCWTPLSTVVKLREHNVVTTCFPDVTLGQRIPDVGVTSCVCWVVVIKRYLSEKVVKIKFKITMVKVGGKHQVQTPPRYNWNIVESGVQHHKNVVSRRLYNVTKLRLHNVKIIWDRQPVWRTKS